MKPLFMPLAICVVLSSCLANKYSITEKAKCDGELQAEEGDIVDGLFDRDQDGYFDGSNPDCAATYDESMLDCDDVEPEMNPGLIEQECDGMDNDCDELTPDSVDADEDGVSSCVDCDDNDSNQTATLGIDSDNDGYDSCEDCDDSNPTVYPANDEICDGIDNNCDGEIDEIADIDNDSDGYDLCSDCDDEDPENHPGNTEICDGKDNNCDGDIDEIANIDIDQDGYDACVDCDDYNPANYPGNEEVCDGIDNNCNQQIDELLDCQTYTDFSDTWLVVPSISYACAFNYVTLNVSALEVTDVNPVILFSGLSGSQPGSMSGSIDSNNHFEASNYISSGGVGCDETYSIIGDFISDTEFNAVLTVEYYPSTAGACFDCTDQSFSITGVR